MMWWWAFMCFFPLLICPIYSSKEAWVVNLSMHSNERGVWIPNIPRPLNGWELGIVECFLPRLQDKVIVVGGEDKVCWLEAKNGSFSIKYLYSILEAWSVELFTTSVVWNVCVPPKVSFFALWATWGKVLTLNQL